jgi:hypothetical protein
MYMNKYAAIKFKKPASIKTPAVSALLLGWVDKYTPIEQSVGVG